jgi:F-type H+-transporting ATPase subunit a
MHISLAAEKIFSIMGFPVTNSLLMTWITMLILIGIGLLVGSNPKLVPGKLQNAIEAILEFFFNLANSILQDRALTARVFPVLCTFLLLIVLSNWLGLVPGVGPIGFIQEVHGEKVILPLFRPTNADINATLSWAIISVFSIQIFGILAIGLGSHVSKFINIKALFSFTFDGVIQFFIGILELFSEISKIVSFSFRLFGNIFAGEVLLTVIAFLVPYIAPLPFYFLEIFVGLIQGVVFTMLTLVFIKTATTSHSHGEVEASH